MTPAGSTSRFGGAGDRPWWYAEGSDIIGISRSVVGRTCWKAEA